nr:arginine--tRNA ligase, chloroplastic/mitochondrial-like isoform X2 [Tanacetum cinerariifolium]
MEHFLHKSRDYKLVSTRLNVIDKWMTLNRRRRIPKNKSCRLGLDLSDDGKGFRTRSIEVVKLIDLLDEAKTPKETLVERGISTDIKVAMIITHCKIEGAEKSV